MSDNASDLLAEAVKRRASLTASAPTNRGAVLRTVRPRQQGEGSPFDNYDEQEQDGGGGLLKNIMSGPAAIASGITQLPTFFGKAVQTGGGVLEGVYDLASEGVEGVFGFDPYTSRLETDLARGRAQGLTGAELFAYAGHRQFPLASEMVSSYARTIPRVAEVGTLGFYDTGEPGFDYKNAYDRGQLGALLVEDIGNLILLGRASGAGNVVSRAGTGIGAAGAPRLGRVISTTGRFIEEPIGSTVRGTARLGQVGAEARGATTLGSRLGRIAQAGLDDTSGPLRQTVVEAREIRRARGDANVAKIVDRLGALDRELFAPNADTGRIKAEINEQKNLLEKALRQSGQVADARKKIVADQIYEEAVRTNIQTEGSRLQARGPSLYYPDAPEGPMPDFAAPVAILIRTGKMEIALREVASGNSIQNIADAMTPVQVGPDLERIGYRYAPEYIQTAVDYAQGNLDPFATRSIDAALEFLSRVGDEFTRGQLSGRYRLEGPMPESYLGTFPLAEFLFAELDRGRFPRTERARIINALDTIAVQFMDTLPPELRKLFKQTAQDPQGAFRALVDLPPDHPLAGVAQQIFELMYDQFLQQFPTIMRDPMIYPANMRPNINAEARLLRQARSADITTIVRGLQDLADVYGKLLGTKLVESIVNDMDTLVGKPEAYLPGSYNRIIGKIDGLMARIRERIAEIEAQRETVTAEKAQTINDLIEAEARLGAIQTTVRALVDNLNRIPDEELPGVTAALEQVELSAGQKRVAEDAIAEYERTARQNELALTPDERQTIIDEIDEAVRLAEGLEYGDNLSTLIDEFEFRQREVESGKVDPTTVEPKPFTNRSKEVKAFRDEMLRVAEDVVKTAFSRQEAFQPGQTISWNAWAVDSDNIFGVPLREAMINELAQYIGIEAATKLADDWAGGRYGNEGFVFPYDEFGINNDRGIGARGLDDWVQLKGTGLDDAQPELQESSYGGVGSTARPDEWSVYIRAMADVWKAEQEVTRIKKLRLYEIADEMNRDRSARDFQTSGYSLPVLARAIAYLTNPNLLTADLRLRDRYASEMEAGLPYEGAPPRLIPIPKELLENLRRADRDVTKQERNVQRLRKEGTAEQRRIVRGQLKGIGKIIEQPDGTVEGQMLKGPQTKAEAEIEQLRNKDLNKQIRLDQLREQFAVQSRMLTDVGDVRQSATAVGTQMAQPFGPQLLGADSQLGYLPGGLPATARDASRVMTELRLEGAAPQVKSPTSMLRTSDIMPLRLDDMMKRFDEIFNVVGRNRVLEDVVMDRRFSVRMGSLVTPKQLEAIVKKAQSDVAAQNLVRTPAQVDAAVKAEVGVRLFEIAQRNGYEAVSPVKVDPTTGAHEALGDLLRTVPAEQIDPNTILMRIGMREKLTQQFVPRGSGNMPDAVQAVGNTLGKFTSEWKSTVLPFSLRWQIGDLVGNVINAWALGDVPPAELFRRMSEIDSLLTSSSKRLESLTGTIENDLISVLIGAGLQARGLRDFDLQQMRGLNPRAAIADYQIQGPVPFLRDTPGFRMFPGFREKSYRFNEYQNTVARAATASIKLERILNERGLTIDSVTPLNYIDDANIRDAVNQAVRETNDALGAFTELNPFEKNVVRNIYPFWSWIRYINKAAVKMAIDHPDRVLFTAALGSIASSPEQEGLFPFLEGRVPMLGYYFDLSFLNPYQDAIILQPNPIKALTEQFQNISPTITAPIRAASAISYYGGGGQIDILGGNIQRPGYLEGQGSLLTGNVSTDRGWGDLLGELGYIGLTTMGGPFRNLPAYGPTGERIPGTDIALGNVQRFPQGSARTEGRYAVQRLSRPAQLAGALLGTFGVPKPIIEQDVAEEQALLQSIKDIQARQRRERERILSRIGQ
jgi:hypothetical protein